MKMALPFSYFMPDRTAVMGGLYETALPFSFWYACVIQGIMWIFLVRKIVGKKISSRS
jgi:hypothetical protein